MDGNLINLKIDLSFQYKGKCHQKQFSKVKKSNMKAKFDEKLERSKDLKNKGYQFINVNKKNDNYQVRYFLEGNLKSNELILCIHGVGGNSGDFEFLSKRLADKFKILRFDQLGIGLSYKPKDIHNTKFYNDQIYNLLTNLKLLDHTIHVIGHSMGGGIVRF